MMPGLVAAGLPWVVFVLLVASVVAQYKKRPTIDAKCAQTAVVISAVMAGDNLLAGDLPGAGMWAAITAINGFSFFKARRTIPVRNS